MNPKLESLLVNTLVAWIPAEGIPLGRDSLGRLLEEQGIQKNGEHCIVPLAKMRALQEAIHTRDFFSRGGNLNWKGRVLIKGSLSMELSGSDWVLSIQQLLEYLNGFRLLSGWCFACQLTSQGTDSEIYHIGADSEPGSADTVSFTGFSFEIVDAFELYNVSFRDCEVKLVRLNHAECKLMGFKDVDLIEVGADVGGSTVVGAKVGLVSLKPRARIVEFIDSRLCFRPKLLKKYSQNLDIPTMMKTCELLEKEESHRADRDVIRRYKAYFESREQWFRRFLYWLNGGYYKILLPLCSVVVLILALGVLGAISTGDCHLAARSLFQPTKLFGLTEIVLADKPKLRGPPCWHEFAPNFTIWRPARFLMLLLIPIYVYSVFSFFVAVKRRFGFGKPAD